MKKLLSSYRKVICITCHLSRKDSKVCRPGFVTDGKNVQKDDEKRQEPTHPTAAMKEHRSSQRLPKMQM
jgi:hypothetical protein